MYEYIYCKVISKGVPRQAEVAQGVPCRLRPGIFFRFRHYKGGRSSAKCTGRLYPEAESTSGHMVQLGVPRKKSPVTSPGIDPGTVRLVAQRLNHYATPCPVYILCVINVQQDAAYAIIIQNTQNLSKFYFSTN